MAIEFACPHCGETMNVDDKYAGTTGPCRSCNQTISIPQTPGAATVPVSPPRSGSNIGVIIGVLVAVIGILVVCGGILAALLWPAIGSARGAARRNACINNQKQITLAILNYESAHREFPPAYSVDETGKPLHSWRVLILPYLEEAGLYSQLDLSKPWDDPANLAITKGYMPIVYQCPEKSGGSTNTNYVVVVDETSAFPPGGTPRKIGEIRDGVSRTICCVEMAGTGVHWSEPVDITVDDLGSLGSDHSGGFTASYLDGHVQFVGGMGGQQLVNEINVSDGL